MMWRKRDDIGDTESMSEMEKHNFYMKWKNVTCPRGQDYAVLTLIFFMYTLPFLLTLLFS
jgi:hypothetical protein